MTKSLNLNYFHILRSNNKATDIEANKAVHLEAGSILKDKEILWDPIP